MILVSMTISVYPLLLLANTQNINTINRRVQGRLVSSHRHPAGRSEPRWETKKPGDNSDSPQSKRGQLQSQAPYHTWGVRHLLQSLNPLLTHFRMIQTMWIPYFPGNDSGRMAVSIMSQPICLHCLESKGSMVFLSSRSEWCVLSGWLELQ